MYGRANVLNECEQMCLANEIDGSYDMLELNMYFGTVGVYQQVLASVYIYMHIHKLPCDASKSGA